MSLAVSVKYPVGALRMQVCVGGCIHSKFGLLGEAGAFACPLTGEFPHCHRLHDEPTYHSDSGEKGRGRYRRRLFLLAKLLQKFNNFALSVSLTENIVQRVSEHLD